MTRRGTMGGIKIAAAVATVLGAAPVIVHGQNPPTTQDAAADAEWRRQMEQRLQQLETENRQLRNDVGQVRETQQAVIKDAQERGVLTLEGGLPRLTTPDFFDINKYAAEGSFPGSIRMPGSKTSMQIGGFVQLDAIVDADRI